MQTIAASTIRYLHLNHQWLLGATEKLTAAQFSWLPGPHAPPIGWHLWHIARWADRLQASLTTKLGEETDEIWQRDQLVLRWELDGSMLGVHQTGPGMAHAEAVRLVQEVEQAKIMDYARNAFAACDAVVDQLTADDLEMTGPSITAFRVDETGQVIEAPPPQRAIANDLMFHVHHSARHLGMIEGLTGAQALEGTATI